MDGQLNVKLIAILMVLVQHVRNERRLYTEEEAAYIFGVHITTMARWRQSGAISYLNLGGDLIRYRWEHLESRMESCQKLSALDQRRALAA
jgi:predicted site-specific integrase-resolvase